VQILLAQKDSLITVEHIPKQDILGKINNLHMEANIGSFDPAAVFLHLRIPYFEANSSLPPLSIPENGIITNINDL
jgi:hypothetical protein